MSDYLAASEALQRMHRDLLDAQKERDELMSVVRRIGSEATEPDALLAQANIVRIVNQTRKAWEARRTA